MEILSISSISAPYRYYRSSLTDFSIEQNSAMSDNKLFDLDMY